MLRTAVPRLRGWVKSAFPPADTTTVPSPSKLPRWAPAVAAIAVAALVLAGSLWGAARQSAGISVLENQIRAQDTMAGIASSMRVSLVQTERFAGLVEEGRASPADLELASSASQRYADVFESVTPLVDEGVATAASSVSGDIGRFLDAVEASDSDGARQAWSSLAQEWDGFEDALAESGEALRVELAGAAGGGPWGVARRMVSALLAAAVAVAGVKWRRRRGRRSDMDAAGVVAPAGVPSPSVGRPETPEEPGQDVQLEPVELVPLVQGLLGSAENVGVRPVVSIPEVGVKADPEALASAIRSLVMAAARRGGSHLGVIARRVDANVEIIVVDDGEAGVGEHERRLSIGLARVEAVVTRMGGRFEFRRRDGVTLCSIILEEAPAVVAAV